MNEGLRAQGIEDEPTLTTVAIGVPGVIVSQGDHLSVMGLPVGLDLRDEWEIYNSSGGQIRYTHGTQFEMRTVSFDGWLVHHYRRHGAKLLTVVSIPPNSAGLRDVALPEGIAVDLSFFPDPEELSLSLRPYGASSPYSA